MLLIIGETMGRSTLGPRHEPCLFMWQDTEDPKQRDWVRMIVHIGVCTITRH